MDQKPERFIHQDHGDSPASHRLVDHQEVVDAAGDAVGQPGPTIFEWKAVLVDASQPCVEIGNDLLRTDDKEYVTRSGSNRTELAAAGRRHKK